MSDFQPVAAEDSPNSAADFQESLFGREELAPTPPTVWEGLRGTGLPGPSNLLDPTGTLSGTSIGSSIRQTLLYGGAAAVHMFTPALKDPELYLPGAPTHKFTPPDPHALGMDWEQRVRDTAKSLDPEPGTQGIGTQALDGLASFATQLAMGGGPEALGLLTVGATSAYEAYHNARDQGLDDATAQKMATADAGVSALFAGLPIGGMAKNAALALRLLAETSAGVAANAGLGAASRYANHKILEDAGYPELADQYQALDRNSILMDTAVGIFPGLHLAGSAMLGGAGRMLHKAALLAAVDGHLRDAASVTADARAARERAPGIPLDPESGAAHSEAEQIALIQTLQNQSIDLSRSRIDTEGATFLQPPGDPAQMAEALGLFKQHLEEEMPGVLKELGMVPDGERIAAAVGVPIPEETPKTPVTEAPVPLAAEPEKPAPTLPKRNMKTPDEREDSILQYLAKHPKGLDVEQVKAAGIDPSEINQRGEPFQKTRWARKGGMSLDEAAERLNQVGYPVSESVGGTTGYTPHALIAAIDRELRGNPVHSLANTRLALEYELEARERAEFDAKVPELAHIDNENKDLAALEVKARAIDNDRATEIKESWEKDDPATIARVRREFQEIINAGVEGDRNAGGERAAGGGGPEHGEAETEGKAAAESLRTPAERNRPATAGSTGAEFSPTGSDAGDRLAGRDAALAREVAADNPDAVVVNDAGQAIPLEEALENAKALEDQASQEATNAFNAAADCFRRNG